LSSPWTERDSWLKPAKNRGSSSMFCAMMRARGLSGAEWTGTWHRVLGMTKDDLAATYRAYIACLNAQDWASLGRFVQEDARHNGRAFGLVGYRAMLERDFVEIPYLRFDIALLVADPPMVAARLAFDCRPKGEFLGLPVNGKRVAFSENVFYEFRDGKIAEVWSVIDKTAIEGQLR